LLAKAVGQLLERVTGLAPSRASPLPHLGCIPRLESGCAVRSNTCAAPRIPSPTAIKTVGAGLLAKAVGQSLEKVAGLAPSRASPLPHLGCIPRLEPSCAFSSNAGAAPRIPARTAIKTVGAGLPAKAVGQSLERVAGLPHSRASPLPHLGCIPRLEPGCVACSNAGAAPRIPAQTAIKPVGAGLPAKAVGQSLEKVTGLAPSRASPLPHLG